MDKDSKDEDLNIPRAAINKFVKDVIPDVRVSNETKEIILRCCNEFIHIVTSEANNICEEQHKKTIASDHILAVFNRLGWPEYKEVVEDAETACKGRKKRQSTKLEHTGISEEELLKQQQELINRAKLEQTQEQEEWSQMQGMLDACLGGGGGDGSDATV
jgi:histone H3/H4